MEHILIPILGQRKSRYWDMALGMLPGMGSMEVLSKNVKALLDQREWSILQAVAEAKQRNLAVSNGTLGRIVKGETATKVNYLDDLAKLLGVEVWHLFIADLNPTNPPVLAQITAGQKSFYENLAKTREAIDGLLQTEGNTRPGGL